MGEVEKEQGDGERERKGAWAIKSCPQMAGSGPSRLTSL